jgi:hypothetical protein
VFSGPLVRSSYMAEMVAEEASGPRQSEAAESIPGRR